MRAVDSGEAGGGRLLWWGDGGYEKKMVGLVLVYRWVYVKHLKKLKFVIAV